MVVQDKMIVVHGAMPKGHLTSSLKMTFTCVWIEVLQILAICFRDAENPFELERINRSKTVWQ